MNGYQNKNKSSVSGDGYLSGYRPLQLVSRDANIAYMQSGYDANSDGVLQTRESRAIQARQYQERADIYRPSSRGHDYSQDVSDFHNDFNRERRQHHRISNFMGGLAVRLSNINTPEIVKNVKNKAPAVALASALALGGGGAIAAHEYYSQPEVSPSDKTITLSQGDVLWDDYENLANDWNTEHPDKPITVDQARSYFDQVNEPIDHDGDGKGDVPQPGDTYVIPDLEERTLFGDK